MNLIQELERKLSLKDIKCKIDRPMVEKGVWDLDMWYEDRHMSVCWQTGRGFGLAHREDACYGEGCDELYNEVDPLLERILELYGISD